MTATRASTAALVTSLVTGALLGTTVFLGAKITNPQPLDWMDVEFYEHLGEPMPPFALETLDGSQVSNGSMAGQQYVLVLVSTGCGACDEVYPLVREAASKVRVVLVATGEREALAAKMSALELACRTVFDSSAVVARAMGRPGYPTAVLVGREGHVVKAGGGTLGTRKILAMAVMDE